MPIPVFDIGGVLLDWSPYYLTERLGYDRPTATAILDEIGFDEWNLALDAGGLWGPAVAALADRFPHHRALIEAFDTRWHEMVGQEIEPVVATLQAFQAAGPVYAITNFSAEKFAVARDRYPYLGRFAGAIVSGEEKLVKPDPAIYRLLLDRYGLAARDCVFIDDRADNVAAARSVGMRAIRYTDPDRLLSDLAAHDLPVPLAA